MSPFLNAVEKLRSPVKELVSVVTEDGTKYVGKTESDQKEVINWIVKSSKIDSDTSLEDLHAVLLPRTYIATNYFTAADIALYGSLYPTISQLQPVQYYSMPSTTRYFDHIQNQVPLRTAVAPFEPVFGVVKFDFEDAPAVERRTESFKKKKVSTTPAAETSSAVPSTSVPVVTDISSPTPPPSTLEKEKKKEKKETVSIGEETIEKKNKGSKTPAPKTPVPKDVGEPVPSMIDLRVGHIIDIRKHPDADGLYVEQIDLGEETGPRTVVSGLVNYIPIEEMRDKYLVAVCNLKPVNMRGVKSFAMVLCAISKEGKEVGIELIQPPPNSRPGERVYFEGPEFENATPLSQLNPKKKVFETVQPGFITLDSKEAAWVNPVTKSVHKIRTKGGSCVAPTLVGASLS